MLRIACSIPSTTTPSGRAWAAEFDGTLAEIKAGCPLPSADYVQKFYTHACHMVAQHRFLLETRSKLLGLSGGGVTTEAVASYMNDNLAAFAVTQSQVLLREEGHH